MMFYLILFIVLCCLFVFWILLILGTWLFGWFYLRAPAFVCGLIVFVVGFILDWLLVIELIVDVLLFWCGYSRLVCVCLVLCYGLITVWWFGWLTVFVIWLGCWFWGSWWYCGVIVLIWFSFYFLLFGLIWIVIVVWLCYFVWLVWLVGVCVACVWLMLISFTELVCWLGI